MPAKNEQNYLTNHIVPWQDKGRLAIDRKMKTILQVIIKDKGKCKSKKL